MEEIITITIDDRETEELFNFLKGYFEATNYYQSRKALATAVNIHNEACREDGSPYLLHPLCVAASLLKILPEDKITDTLVSAALLHDAIEEGGLKVLEEAGFDNEILDIVRILSKSKGYTGSQLENYFCQIAKSKNGWAALIKGADRLHNIQSVHHFSSSDRMRRYLFESRILVLPMLTMAANLHPAYAVTFSIFHDAIKSYFPAMEMILEFRERECVQNSCIDVRTHLE